MVCSSCSLHHFSDALSFCCFHSLMPPTRWVLELNASWSKLKFVNILIFLQHSCNNSSEAPVSYRAEQETQEFPPSNLSGLFVKLRGRWWRFAAEMVPSLLISCLLFESRIDAAVEFKQCLWSSERLQIWHQAVWFLTLVSFTAMVCSEKSGIFDQAKRREIKIKTLQNFHVSFKQKSSWGTELWLFWSNALSQTKLQPLICHRSWVGNDVNLPSYQILDEFI